MQARRHNGPICTLELTLCRCADSHACTFDLDSAVFHRSCSPLAYRRRRSRRRHVFRRLLCPFGFRRRCSAKGIAAKLLALSGFSFTSYASPKAHCRRRTAEVTASRRRLCRFFSRRRHSHRRCVLPPRTHVSIEGEVLTFRRRRNLTSKALAPKALE